MQIITVNSHNLIPRLDTDGTQILYSHFTGTLKECQEKINKLTWINYPDKAFWIPAEQKLIVPVSKNWIGVRKGVKVE